MLSFLIYSGSWLGSIYHHDVWVAQHHVGTLCQNKQSICSLKWSLTNQLLASGSSDGILNIWPSDPVVKLQSQPLKTTSHSSAVKVYGEGMSAFLYLLLWNHVAVDSHGIFQIISLISISFFYPDCDAVNFKTSSHAVFQVTDKFARALID